MKKIYVYDEDKYVRSSHLACNNGDLKMCKLLDKYNCDWEAEDLEKLTPINYAIRSGD